MRQSTIKYSMIIITALAICCLLAFYIVANFFPSISLPVLFSVLFWIIASSGLYLYKIVGEFDYFAPILPSFVLLYLYSISSALSATYMGATIYKDVVDSGTLLIYYLSCIIGLYALCVGFIWGHTKKIAKSVLAFRSLSDSKLLHKLLIYAPLSYMVFFQFAKKPFDFINVKSYSETSLTSRIESMADPSLPILEVFCVYIPVTSLLCFATVIVFRKYNVFLRSLGLFILFSFSATALLAGSRSAIAQVGMLMVIFYNYRIKKISGKSFIAMFFVGYIVVNTMALIRVTKNPLEMVQVLYDNLNSDISFLALEKSSELLTGQNLMRLISGIRDGETGYTYGFNVFTELATYIPRILYPGRPLPLSELFVETFYPGVRDSGGGYGFFYLMEGYWALGLVGVLLFMLTYARLVQLVYEKFYRNAESDFAVLWYAFILSALVMTAVRSGIIGVFKGSLMSSIPFILIYILPSIGLIKSKVKSRKTDTIFEPKREMKHGAQ